MDQKKIAVVVDNVYFLIMAITITNLNKGIKQFFTSQLVMLIIFTLYNYQRNQNVLLSLATAIGMVVFVLLITADSSMFSETFELIYPTPGTIKGCENITVKDLVEQYKTEANLKRVMDEAGVPYNLSLTDTNAPEIASYILNTIKGSSFGGSCHTPL